MGGFLWKVIAGSKVREWGNTARKEEMPVNGIFMCDYCCRQLEPIPLETFKRLLNLSQNCPSQEKGLFIHHFLPLNVSGGSEGISCSGTVRPSKSWQMLKKLSARMEPVHLTCSQQQGWPRGWGRALTSLLHEADTCLKLQDNDKLSS